jgi:hypothetical protein
MPGELQQINDGVERQVNIVVNNLMYDPQAIARLLAWLSQRYPLRNFIFRDKFIWASGIRFCTMTFRWRLALPAPNR